MASSGSLQLCLWAGPCTSPQGRTVPPPPQSSHHKPLWCPHHSHSWTFHPGISVLCCWDKFPGFLHPEEASRASWWRKLLLQNQRIADQAADRHWPPFRRKCLSPGSQGLLLQSAFVLRAPRISEFQALCVRMSRLNALKVLSLHLKGRELFCINELEKV